MSRRSARVKRATCTMHKEGRMKKCLAIVFGLSLAAIQTSGFGMSRLEGLALDGYAVVERTQVDGEFEGCEFDKRIPLMNGMIFVCQGYSYSYAFMPEVLILQNIHHGGVRVLIDRDGYPGTLYR